MHVTSGHDYQIFVAASFLVGDDDVSFAKLLQIITHGNKRDEGEREDDEKDGSGCDISMHTNQVCVSRKKCIGGIDIDRRMERHSVKDDVRM
jgi:hypothetical protein